MALDFRDAALQASCPVVSAPLFGPLESSEDGQRMVLARNGLFLEMTTPWLRCRVKVASLEGELRLPYGELRQEVVLVFGGFSSSLIEAFIEAARDECPREVAGGIIYNQFTGTQRLTIHESISASGAHVNYRVEDLAEGEYLVLDLHSHGVLDAFWSAQDNRDDQGVKVCGVFGNLDKASPSARMRLAINGHFVDLPNQWQARFRTGAWSRS